MNRVATTLPTTQVITRHRSLLPVRLCILNHNSSRQSRISRPLRRQLVTARHIFTLPTIRRLITHLFSAHRHAQTDPSPLRLPRPVDRTTPNRSSPVLSNRHFQPGHCLSSRSISTYFVMAAVSASGRFVSRRTDQPVYLVPLQNCRRNATCFAKIVRHVIAIPVDICRHFVALSVIICRHTCPRSNTLSLDDNTRSIDVI
jgi:hypothetical protein